MGSTEKNLGVPSRNAKVCSFIPEMHNNDDYHLDSWRNRRPGVNIFRNRGPRGWKS